MKPKVAFYLFKNWQANSMQFKGYWNLSLGSVRPPLVNKGQEIEKYHEGLKVNV